MTEPDFIQDESVERIAPESEFCVDLDGFEGPLDLLLELARRQKVDLHRISILALVNQYLAFIEAARRVRLELAADYLVMAAWLAFLKSRLLIPSPPKADEPPGAELAEQLSFRLQRLEAVRKLAQEIGARPRLGREFFLRGQPETTMVSRRSRFTATLFDLLNAYARQRQQQALSQVTVKQRQVWSLVDARDALERLMGAIGDWSVLDDYLIAYCANADLIRTVRASTFSASLEMVREGRLELRQDHAFAPLWIRTRCDESESEPLQEETQSQAA